MLNKWTFFSSNFSIKTFFLLFSCINFCTKFLWGNSVKLALRHMIILFQMAFCPFNVCLWVSTAPQNKIATFTLVRSERCDERGRKSTQGRVECFSIVDVMSLIVFFVGLLLLHSISLSLTRSYITKWLFNVPFTYQNHNKHPSPSKHNFHLCVTIFCCCCCCCHSPAPSTQHLGSMIRMKCTFT